MTDDRLTELALEAGAAKFYPKAQGEWSERNYLVGLRFLQRFALAVMVEARVDGAKETPTVDAAFAMVDRLRERGELPAGVLASSEALIDAAEKHAANYEGDPRQDIKTDVLNAFYAGAKWAGTAGVRESYLDSVYDLLDIAKDCRTPDILLERVLDLKRKATSGVEPSDPLDRAKAIRERVAELEAERDQLIAEHSAILGSGTVDESDIEWARNAGVTSAAPADEWDEFAQHIKEAPSLEAMVEVMRLKLDELNARGVRESNPDHLFNEATLAGCAETRRRLIEVEARRKAAAAKFGLDSDGVAMADCGNGHCNWRGPLSECSYVGAVGPCCPECREIVEPDAPGVPEWGNNAR